MPLPPRNVLLGLGILLLCGCALPRLQAGEVIVTICGDGTAGSAGDSGAAVAAQFNSPTGVALDNAGNVYVADKVNNRIRKIDAGTGIISTVAGTGMAGYSGDGGAAVNAALKNPCGIAIAANGSLFIADTGNHIIRKVLGGTISTVAGNGAPAFGGDNGTALSAALNSPASVAVDAAGNLYIADSGNHRVRKVDGFTGVITTIAGNGTAAFGGDDGPALAAALNPRSVVIDASGNVLIADTGNHRVRSSMRVATSQRSPATATRVIPAMARPPQPLR